jgi:hypothetical protein
MCNIYIYTAYLCTAYIYISQGGVPGSYGTAGSRDDGGTQHFACEQRSEGLIGYVMLCAVFAVRDAPPPDTPSVCGVYGVRFTEAQFTLSTAWYYSQLSADT